jgi:hypothetical protein
MDTITLVNDQIDDGQSLLARLARENIPVRVACWVKPVEEDRWSLYIATPLVEEKGPIGAYREVCRVMRLLGSRGVTDSDVKLIGEKHPITDEVLQLHQRHAGRTPIRSRRPLLGGLPVQEVYVYPPPLDPAASGSGQRRLKKPVEQIARPEDALLTEEERAIRNQIVSSGVNLEDAEKWVRVKRSPSPARPPIPAGTVVKSWVTAFWGSRLEDDPNPLLMVEAPDGARGLVLKNDTEPV